MGGRTHAARLARAMVVGLAVLALGFLAGLGASSLSSRAVMQAEADRPASQQPAQESQQDVASQVVADTGDERCGTWNATESPNYYRVLGLAQVGEVPHAGTVVYGELDRLGRATGAVALVTYDSMQAGRARSRGDTSAMEPSGWGHNAEVDMAMPDGSVYHGLLFNRSHLLAKSLGGAEDLRNLITGTRTQNVGANVDGSEGGMAYAEGLARSWLEGHPTGSLYYAATPVYEGDELLARSVLVDVRSSDGTLDQRIEVYNAALGFDIDYATGGFEATGDATSLAQGVRATTGASAQDGVAASDAGATGAAATVVPTGTPGEEGSDRKVIVTRSGKAYHHDETCRGLANARSMEWVSVSEAEAMGRHPCGICGG